MKYVIRQHFKDTGFQYLCLTKNPVQTWSKSKFDALKFTSKRLAQLCMEAHNVQGTIVAYDLRLK